MAGNAHKMRVDERAILKLGVSMLLAWRQAYLN